MGQRDYASANARGFGLGIVAVDVRNRDLRALFDEGLGNAGANPATTTGNQHNLARDIHASSSCRNFSDRHVA